MGIDAVLRAKSKEDLASVPDPQMLLSRATTSGAFSGTQLLKYLVPWGDAIFNQAQAQALHEDIRLLTARDSDTPLAKRLLEIDVLVDRLAKETHSYLWFIGD